MTHPQHDALELLAADHLAVRQLFDTYRSLAGHEASGGRRRAVAEQACMRLTIHAKLEEELFYPAAREAVRDDDLLDALDVEHACVRDLVCQILAMGPDEELYDAKVTVLGQYVLKHIEEEERELFPRLRHSGVDLALMAQRLAERRQELEAVPEALREEALVSAMA